VSGAASVAVTRVESPGDERAFLRYPYALHEGSPGWVAPLLVHERDRWRPASNPSLGRLRAARWVARRGDAVVGRIAAFVDPGFQRWEADCGFFGFLDCADDAAASSALLAAAEACLRSWGCRRVAGPVHFTTNEEVGLLTAGFERRSAVLTPYDPPYLAGLLASSGYVAWREYGAWEWTPAASLSRAIRRLARRGVPGVRVRPLEPRRFDDEVGRLHDLYNRAFSELWGFVPMDEAEFRSQAASFRPFHRPDLVLFAEVDGEPEGFAVLLPDVNEALAGLGGRLLPFGWLRLAVRVRRIRSGRFLLLGVSPTQRSRGLGPLLAVRTSEAATAAGFERVEISLVQASNERMVRVIEAMGCRRTRTFVLFQKELTSAGVT
jgi:GNAT superfamily N-acetyltransferase